MYKLWAVLAGLISSIGLFVSAWIVVPAPIFSLLPLGVGAPEISPWLIVFNVLGLCLSLSLSVLHTKQYLPLFMGVIALFLSMLPLLHFSTTNQAANIAMQTALGNDYLVNIPPAIQERWRSAPFVLADAFRGMPMAKSAIDVRQTTGIKFAQPAGIPLTLNLYQPAASGQYPGIVSIYGGAWQRGTPGDNAEFNRYLAGQGYVVLSIDYRHAPHHQFPAQLNDIKSALTFIGQHVMDYEVDPERIALLGRSAGAHLAMLAAYQASPIPIQAVVSYYGPIDLAAGYREPPQPDPIDSRATLKIFMGSSPQEEPQKYQQASPIEQVVPGLPPTLLIYGGRDHIVESKYGKKMGQRLQAAGNQAVFMEIPWAEHAFDTIFHGVSNQLALYYTERFLAWALH